MKNYVGLSSHTFSVIKKGSTDGKLLTKIEMQFSVYNREGIGTQDILDLASEIKLVTGEVMKNRGPFYSIESRNDIARSSDAIALADKIDFVGYKTKAAGTNPVTAPAFDVLIHDNEFDVLLAGIATSGTTYAGPVGFNEVYGFVIDDGRRGMIRTIIYPGDYYFHATFRYFIHLFSTFIYHKFLKV